MIPKRNFPNDSPQYISAFFDTFLNENLKAYQSGIWSLESPDLERGFLEKPEEFPQRGNVSWVSQRSVVDEEGHEHLLIRGSTMLSLAD